MEWKLRKEEVELGKTLNEHEREDIANKKMYLQYAKRVVFYKVRARI